ncbi:ABC transporter substrate-binding protein [Microbacterium rhizomatis]|uniref:Transporter substrate-binding domain-containing protein n=1 Tax=Microbacterium rhizomatis TaxID=1631477 RepID=A0A5J5J5U9_9MICO|nr:ABC transporter substrate-binding protein [Microbacterium rhizomatis]KAA9111440.1 transporter substrate-binding domain-containing protein [Microbacterium rhizomatis]
MALSRKQGITIGAAAVALVAIVGIVTAVTLNRPAEAAAEPAPSASASGNTTTDEITWVDTDPVPEAVAALKASGFTPATPGKLTVAVGAFVPPLSYVPEGETLPAGTEPNIGKLIAEGLGLEYNPVVVAWADWPLGIQSGKYDLITANVTVTEERKELYDFASYRQDLLGFYVRADSKIDKIQEAADISGLKIVVGSGTNQEQVLLKWNEELAAAGKAPAELQYYDDNAAATLALESGRVDANFGPNATSAWAARETGQTKLVGIIPGGWPLAANIAAGTAKGNGLIEPVSIVLNALIADGKYQDVLEAWGLESEGIDESVVNPPGLPKS